MSELGNKVFLGGDVPVDVQVESIDTVVASLQALRERIIAAGPKGEPQAFIVVVSHPGTEYPNHILMSGLGPEECMNALAGAFAHISTCIARGAAVQ